MENFPPIPWASLESVATGVGQIEHGPYIARMVTHQDEQQWLACQRLRYDYFVRRRGWIEGDAAMDGLEVDSYDDFALHLAVFDGAEAAAYLRLLPATAPCGFMLEHEFACLLDGKERRIVRAGAVELSRLVYWPSNDQRPVAESLTGSPAVPHPVELLLKLLYRVALAQEFEHFYIVVEESWLRPFARRFGLVFSPVGTPHVFPGGTRTVAATATLAGLQESMQRHSRAKFNWYHQ